MAQIRTLKELEKRVSQRIGLALSGGGYRASLFHLGVIRRLEELGIMQDVSVISCISGGSIIGAFYMAEMEQRLRSRRAQIADIWQECENISRSNKKKENQAKLKIAKIRLELFEEIAEKFFVAMDKNMRMRATLFAPFFHISWVKTLFSKNFTRAEIIQYEYDKWLFHNGVVDFLPSYHIITAEDFEKWSENQTEYQLRPGYHVYKTNGEIRAQLGTKIVINATSLLNGENKSYYRIPILGFTEMRKANENIEKLSKVVGASSAVPGVFPPAVIGGDVLADGGVSDNQGLHLFLGEEQKEDHHGPLRELHEECDVLLVSDASGQMLKIDQIDRKEIPVLVRTQGIQSFELRNKNIDLLVKWIKNPQKKGKRETKRFFAFIQLYRSLKDREEFVGQNRVPSEYVSALGGIRTDLDQFSHIEREALMYHGYTLIDSQLREWCRDFLKERGVNHNINSKTLNQKLAKIDNVYSIQKLRKPPLFRETNVDKWLSGFRRQVFLLQELWHGQWRPWGTPIDESVKLRKYREKIKNHLEAGSSLLLTKRLFTDRPIFVSIYYLIVMVCVFYLASRNMNYIQMNIAPRLQKYLESLVASGTLDWLEKIFRKLTELMGFENVKFQWPLTEPGMGFLTTLLVIALGGYVIAGLFYRFIGQPASMGLDKALYKQLTGKSLKKYERAYWEEADKAMLDFRVCTQKSFKWPEAIDIDGDGTLYFTDVFEKALYRIKRGRNGRLESHAEKLIEGFQHVAGISVNQNAGLLYLGIQAKGDKKSSGRIARLPIDIFDACAKKPLSYEATKARLEKASIKIQESPIAGKPNGIVFTPHDGETIFYTDEKLPASFLGKKGHIGSTQPHDKYERITPNGIDIAPSANGTTTVSSLFRKNKITQLIFRDKQFEKIYESKPLKRRILGAGLDGLICMENGDVLAAAYWWGEVLYFAWDGASYAEPVTIAKDLGNPTDLAVGRSANGNGNSLYVTSTKLWRVWLGGGGKVVEIPDIENRIANAEKSAQIL